MAGRTLRGSFEGKGEGIAGRPGTGSAFIGAPEIGAGRRSGPAFLAFVDAVQLSILKCFDQKAVLDENDVENLRLACNLIREAALGASRKEGFEDLKKGEMPFLGRVNFLTLVAPSCEFKAYLADEKLAFEQKLGRLLCAIERYLDIEPQKGKEAVAMPKDELAVLNSIMHALGGGYIVRYRTNFD